MKTGEKLSAGWLLILGFMFLTRSAFAVIDNIAIQKASSPPLHPYDYPFPKSDAEYLMSQNDEIAFGGLIFGVPTLALGGWLTIGLYRQNRQAKKVLEQQKNEQLQSVFYRMIQENNGRINLISFAMQSQLPPPVVKEYLDEQAKVFNANYKISEEGGISYHFDI